MKPGLYKIRDSLFIGLVIVPAQYEEDDEDWCRFVTLTRNVNIPGSWYAGNGGGGFEMCEWEFLMSLEELEECLVNPKVGGE